MNINPATVNIAPIISTGFIFSLKIKKASGKTNNGSTVPRADAIAISRCLIATMDSQNPPKVIMQTEPKKDQRIFEF